MSSSRFIALVPVLGLCAAPSLAQVSVQTKVVEVQTIGACVDFKYPKTIRAQNYSDVQESGGREGGGGNGITGVLQTQVTDKLTSRDGVIHSVDELVAADYKPQTDGTLKLDFKVGRQSTFKLCIKPGVISQRGLVMTYDTQIRDLKHTINTDKRGAANKYISKSKEQEVDADNEAFKREVDAAIKALRDDFAARRDVLKPDEAGMIFEEAGHAHPVLVTFAEQTEQVTVKVRTPPQ